MNLLKMAFLTVPVCALLATPPPGIPDGWSDGFVYANGIGIHYYHAVPALGKPVIVMVHGVTDNGLCWTTLTEELQNSYDIYMADTRGHGLSHPFTEADNGETLIEDVVGFVRAMKFEKPILMGHSMGAATVMRVGAEYPDLARAIIMLDPLLGRFPPGGPAGPAQSAPEPGHAPPARARGGMFGTPEELVAQNNSNFDKLVATCRTQTPKWDPVDCQYWALSKKQYHGPYSATQMQAMMGTMQIGDSLSKITAPAGAGHNLHHDQRQRTVEALRSFLSTL